MTNYFVSGHASRVIEEVITQLTGSTIKLDNYRETEQISKADIIITHSIEYVQRHYKLETLLEKQFVVVHCNNMTGEAIRLNGKLVISEL